MNILIKFGIGIVAVLALLLLGPVGCSEVPAGHRGVFVNYGKPTSQVGEGLQIYNAWTNDLVVMNTRQITWTSNTEAYTKDVQQAGIKFTVSYNLQPGAALKTYRSVGEDWDERIVPQIVEQTIKDVFGQSEAVKDTINRRTVVRDRILSLLRTRFAARNITVIDFELRDIEFSPAFEKAVEAKQVAVETALAERNKTVAVQERANQRVIAAKADAEAMRIKTEALTGNAKLVEYEAVQKWNV
jgi:regulator of protease activity HflC (stomatin/prohibitin superfamily)